MAAESPSALPPEAGRRPPEMSSAQASAWRFAAAHFAGSRGSHAWDHTLRVYRLCEHIGHAEGADMEVLRIAALLHDIGRLEQDASGGAVCHAEKGAEMAQPVVAGLGLTHARRDNVLHCIRSHRFRGGQAPATPEARVLFDADKLDGIGAVGVARAFLFAGEVGARLHSPETPAEQTRAYTADDTGYREFCVKLSKVKDRILTPEGRRIAAERHNFMEAFFSRFLEEYDGLK